MALSNIFNEPRREITESAVGLLLFFGMLGLSLPGARWLRATDAPEHRVNLAIYLFFSLLGLMILCNVLANRGLELRPRRRERGY